MIYTIMSTEDITLEQALTAYNEQVRLIAFGLYSINDRREILQNGFKSFK